MLTQVEHLDTILTSDQPLGVKVDQLLNNVTALRCTDLPLGLRYCEEALRLSETHDYLQGIAVSLWQKGTLQLTNAEYEAALLTLKIALQQAEKLGDHYLRGSIHSSLARAYIHLGDHSEALEHNLQCLALMQGYEIPDEQAQIEHRTGTLYQHIGDPKQALQHYQKALEIFQTTTDMAYQAQLLGLIGTLQLHDLADYPAALTCYTKGLGLHAFIDEPKGKAFLLAHLGLTYHYLEQNKRAIPFLHEGLHLYESLSNVYGQAQTLGWIGKCLCAEQDFTQALPYLQQAVDLTDTLKVQDLYANYLYLADCYKSLQQPSQALPYYEQYYQIKETIQQQTLQAQNKKLLATMRNFEEEHTKRHQALTQRSHQIIARQRHFTHLQQNDLHCTQAEAERLHSQIKTLQSEKKHILHLIAHDFESPLMGLKLVSSMVKTHYNKIPSDQIYQHLTTMAESAQNLFTTVTNLIDMLALDSHQNWPVRTIELCPLLERLQDQWQDFWQTKQLQFSIECSLDQVQLPSDQILLFQLLDSLLRFATKYLLPGAGIQLAITATTTETLIEVDVTQPNQSTSAPAARKTYNILEKTAIHDIELWFAYQLIQQMQGEFWFYQNNPTNPQFRLVFAKQDHSKERMVVK